MNHVKNCLSRAAGIGASSWTQVLAGSSTAWELQGSSSWGMFVLLLENLEWSGWEESDAHLIEVVW